MVPVATRTMNGKKWVFIIVGGADTQEDFDCELFYDLHRDMNSIAEPNESCSGFFETKTRASYQDIK